MCPDQEMAPRPRKAKKKEGDLEFNPQDVFSPSSANHSLEEIDAEMLKLKARHGQAGTRHGNSAPVNDAPYAWTDEPYQSDYYGPL